MWHRGESLFAYRDVVQSIRNLQEGKIFERCLNPLWSERRPLRRDGLSEAHASMCEDFAGIGMSYHRVDLIRTPDRFIGQSERGHVRLGSAVWGGGATFGAKRGVVGSGKGGVRYPDRTCFRTIAPFQVLARAIHTGSHSTFVWALSPMCL